MRSIQSLVIAFIAWSAATAGATPPPGVEPTLFGDGNLRVSLACADTFLTADNGLRVSLDGSLLEPLGTSYASYFWTDTDGNLAAGSAPVDVGYLVAPGHHHVRIESPDCEVDERDIDIAGTYPETVVGRLPVARADLRGPTGAPDGIALAFGLVSSAYPASLRSGSDFFGSSYTVDPMSSTGGWLGVGVERRHFAFWYDTTFAWGSMAGNVWSSGTSSASPAMMDSYTATNVELGMAARIGARLPMGSLALAGGTGIGGTMDITTGGHTDTGSMPSYSGPEAPSGVSAAWYVPLWTAVTVKPSCSWGLQAVASYDVQPTESGMPGGLELLAGAEWQPSIACSDPVHVRVVP